MALRYHDLAAEPAGQARVRLRFRLENRTRLPMRSASGQHIGFQIFDPATALFISEGEWSPLEVDIEPGQSASFELNVAVPPQDGPYRLYLSPVDEKAGWSYANGHRFVVADVSVRGGEARVGGIRETTLGALRRENLARTLPGTVVEPFRMAWRNRRLIRSMVRRDLLARYRGSFGDVLWTVLNPLLLMATYFFVFGVVLRTRFAADTSRFGFALYFLAGMLPWLPFSEAIGRSPITIVEHRNFVKKLVFPIEVLPLNLTLSGLVTGLFALALFVVFLLLTRGFIPITALWLPALVIPQFLLTAGLCWFLAALGVYVRDLGQVIGFVLTLWFFVTPICYPESSMPGAALPLLGKNPLYILVRGYRAAFLEGHAPGLRSLSILWVLSLLVAIAGYAWFNRLRRSFADVI
jgi:lipopolysaccharide transport system permease protein